MAVRPPTNDTSEPAVIEFGIAALDARIDADALAFPVTSEDVLAAVDDTEVPVDGAGNAVELARVFDRAEQPRFETRAELLDVLQPIFEAFRTEAESTVIGRLHRLVPL
ncbi:MAG: hypothetical protein ACQETB_05310 [Halobacteriota archaeon]